MREISLYIGYEKNISDNKIRLHFTARIILNAGT